MFRRKTREKDIFENISPDNVNESAKLLGEAYYEAAIEKFPQTKFMIIHGGLGIGINNVKKLGIG